MISVLMPVYNAERYVVETVESILAQTFTDFEFIIIDDGSRDTSPVILKAYAARDQRIRFTARENKGVAPTRNDLLAQARGEFLAIIDADDVALPERFALQVAFLRAHPEILCVGGAQELIDDQGRLLTHLALPEDDETIQALLLAGHCSICQSCAMIRREAVIQVGGYDETTSSVEDLDLWLRLGEIGALANLKETVVKYRLLTNSLSGQTPEKQRQKAQKACERAWQRRGVAGRFEAIEPWRPTLEPTSRHYFMLQYGWWAFYSDQCQTAMIYAWRAIKAQPLSIKGWKLLVIAAIKQVPIKSQV